MRIFHFIRGKANKDRANGVNQAIAGLAKYSAKEGAELRVIGKAEAVAEEGEQVRRDSFSVQAYSRWSPELLLAIRESVTWADVVHLHGIYSPANILVAQICADVGRPYVVTLHGGLSPEMRRRSWLRKKAFDVAIQRRHLQRAAAVHVLTEEEATDLFSVARPKHVLCVPNGVDLDDFPRVPDLRTRRAEEAVLAYLGRLSPEKNLEALCGAFIRANTTGRMRLRLAGPITPYGADLLRRFGERGVELVGPKFGQDKVEFIRSADLFVHPSRSDVFSIAAMEVLAIGTPLLITRTSHAAYFFDRQAYHMCEPTTHSLENGIRSAIARASEWPHMARNGRALIEERLNWAASAKSLLSGYAQVLPGPRE